MKDNADFVLLRDGLLAQFKPGTAIQTVAFEQIVVSSWRCKHAIRLEMKQLTPSFTTSEGAASDESGGQRDERVFQWFGASYQDLTQGISFLKALRAEGC